MNQAIRKLSGLLVLPVLLAALLLMPVRALAAGYECDAQIPVTVKLNGDHAEAFEVTIALPDGADADTPMPEEGSRSLLLRGGESGSFAIHYTAPGDYFYLIRQTAGKTGYMTYDDTVYAVQVQVTNTEDADGNLTLAYTVTAYDAGIEDPTQENKTGELAFLNTYAPPTPTPTPATDGGQAATPTPTPTPTPEPDPVQATPTAAPLLGIIPQTGDALPLTLLVVVLVATAVAIAVLIVAKKRNTKQDNQP